MTSAPSTSSGHSPLTSSGHSEIISNPINYQQLIELYDTDPEQTLDTLGPTFLSTTDPLIANLHTSFDNNDAATLAAYAHQLYGNAAAIAAERLQALAARVEEFAREENWTQIGIWLPALKHESQQVLDALRSRTDML